VGATLALAGQSLPCAEAPALARSLGRESVRETNASQSSQSSSGQGWCVARIPSLGHVSPSFLQTAASPPLPDHAAPAFRVSRSLSRSLALPSENERALGPDEELGRRAAAGGLRALSSGQDRAFAITAPGAKSKGRPTHSGRLAAQSSDVQAC
jgi:hypothetical protein